MKTKGNILLGAAIAVFVLTAGACGKSEEKKETVGEKVGGAIDKAVDQAGQVMEKAGDAMKEAGEKMKEGKK